MTTPSFSRVEAYVWSDGVLPPVFGSCQRFEAAQGVGTSDRVLAEPQPFSAALDAIVAGLDADLPGTFGWAFTANGLLALYSTAAFDVTWHDAAQAGFGFSGAQVGASTYESTAPVLLAAPIVPIDCEPAGDGAIVELVEARHGRAFATHFANCERWRLRFAVRAAIADAFTAGYCGRGRVRVYFGADASPLSSSNLDGHVDGWVYGCAVDDALDADGWVDVELLIARAAP